MSDFATPIELPMQRLPQRHGLWSSAYHLIHPTSSLDASFESQFADFDSISSNMQYWEGGTGSPIAEAHPSLGISFQTDCVGELGCWGICDNNYNCQDPEAPRPR